MTLAACMALAAATAAAAPAPSPAPGEGSLLDSPSPEVRGAWIRAAGLEPPSTPGAHWLVPLTRGATDGTLRVRLADADRGPFAVVFGARLGPRREALEGYALRVVDRWAHLVRVSGRGLEKVTDTVLIPRRAARASLEARLVLLGERVVATIADGDTGEVLAITSADGLAPRGLLVGVAVLDAPDAPAGDGTSARGGVPPVPGAAASASPVGNGVTASPVGNGVTTSPVGNGAIATNGTTGAPAPRNDAPAPAGSSGTPRREPPPAALLPRIAELAFRPACRSVPRGADAGPPIVVGIPVDEAFLASGTALELEPAPDGETMLFRTGTLGLERLFCEGRTLAGIATDVPWKFRDLVYYFSARWDLGAADPLPYRQTYKDARMVEAALRALAARHPATSRLEVIGTTHEGRPVLALAAGARVGGPVPSVLLTGGTHADEQMSTEIVLDALARLLDARDGAGDPALADLTVWGIPLVNPDGLAAFLDLSERAGRKNGRDLDGDGVRSITEGVDLNRNFPAGWAAPCELCGSPSSRVYRGPSPASEPETRALMALATREHFVASISYHVGDVAVLAPYSVSILENPAPNEAWTVAEELVARLPPHPEGRPWTVRHSLYDVQGTDQDWLRHDLGTVAFLVESCGWPSPPAPAARDAMLAALRPTWQALVGRVLGGPALAVTVRGEDGTPLVAEVRLDEQRVRAGERWLTRERDGRQDRLLPRPGTYHVEVLAPGHAPWRGQLPIGHERRDLAVTLRPSSGVRPAEALR